MIVTTCTNTPPRYISTLEKKDPTGSLVAAFTTLDGPCVMMYAQEPSEYRTVKIPRPQYVARFTDRSGLRVSSRNAAAASIPIIVSIANNTASPGDPENTFAGIQEAAEYPSGP